MAVNLNLCFCFVLEVFDCARCEVSPVACAGRPTQPFLKQRKQRLHPASNGLLFGEERGYRPLQQPIGKPHLARGKHVASSLICNQANSQPLRSIAMNFSETGTAMHEKARDIPDRHPIHVADIEIH